MKTNNNARRHRSEIIKSILNEITPAEKKRVREKMILAARLFEIVQSKGLSKTDFAKLMDKNASEISKWLSGTHNFTIDTLSDISLKLQVPISEFYANKVTSVHSRSNCNIVLTVEDVSEPLKVKTPWAELCSHFQLENLSKSGFNPESKYYWSSAYPSLVPSSNF